MQYYTASINALVTSSLSSLDLTWFQSTWWYITHKMTSIVSKIGLLVCRVSALELSNIAAFYTIRNLPRTTTTRS